MADHLDLPPSWNGHRARVGGNRRRVRLSCDQLESRDATGSIVSGVVAAAFGAPLSDSMSELARLIGDWAFLDAAIRTSPPAGPMAPIADESPRTLARYDTWLDPQLLFPEERAEHGVRVTAPPAPANPGRAAFGDLLGGPPHLSGPTHFGPFPSFVGVRAGPQFVADRAEAVVASVGLRVAGATLASPGTGAAPNYGVAITHRYLEQYDPIPNQAPQAVDDSVTVDEDDSLLFNPATNDTDPDGDALWVKYVDGETAHGRVSCQEGGLIRYIPNPNYNNTAGQPYYGPDSFTYTVTDGLAEATGTVSVTVNAINDAPLAANDVLVFVNPMWEYPGPPDMLVQYVSDYNPGLLANDRDGDGYYGGVSVDPADVDLTGTAGTVSVSGGSVSWGGPKSFNGETSFRYRATDPQGLKSDWVTVKLLVRRPSDPGGSVTGVADVIPVGDGPDSGNVMANDAGAFVALSSLPSSGRLIDFGFDGKFEFWSDHTRSEPVFKYVVFSANGGARTEVEDKLPAVNLTIHHGQDGKAVLELNERMTAGGAAGGNPLLPAFKATSGFTVANQNDSDADNSPDAFDSTVPENPAFDGSGEKDLMKLVMSKPAAVAGFPNVTLSVSSASTPGMVPAVNFWKVSIKGNQPQALDAQGKAAIPVNAIPAELWVELTGVSPAIGDVSIKMEYAGATDTVNVTGIWTKHDSAQTHQWPDGYFMANGEKALPAEADARFLQSAFKSSGGELGVVANPNLLNPGPPPVYNLSNNERAKFLLMPSGLSPFSVLGIVYFDTSRSVDGRGARNGNPIDNPLPNPYWLDFANDDPFDQSEDNDLVFNRGRSTTDFTFSLDGPGESAWESKGDGVYLRNTNTKVTDFVQRGNFFDFVRMQIGKQFVGGPPPPGTLVKGSRVSVYYSWHTLMHLVADNKGGPWMLVRSESNPLFPENRIGMGHVNLG